MDPVVFTHDADLTALRRRRAELRESIDALEQALAAPAFGRAGSWAERIQAALVELSADFREHVTVTEGRGGLHQDVITAAPRLANAVARLARDHTTIIELVQDVLAGATASAADEDVDAIRDRGMALLAALARHRQRGADLVYEAYHADIGGET